MGGTIAPFPKHQFPDNNGNPAVGYQLFTYEAGSSTKLATYTDADLMSSNTNPIVLDGAGRATIFLQPTSYKFVLAPPTDTDPPVSPVWTVDDVSAVPVLSGSAVADVTAGENIASGEVIYLSDGSGGKTQGRWYLAKADQYYSSVEASALGIATAAVTAGATVPAAVRLEGSVPNMAASPGVRYYVSGSSAGQLVSTAPPIRCIVGESDEDLSLVLSGQSKYSDSMIASASGVGTQNLVRNGEFEIWDDGPLLAPQGWVVSGTGAVVRRTGSGEADTVYLGTGTYAAKIISGVAESRLTQTVLTATDLSRWQLKGRHFTVQAKVKGAANIAKILTDDGVTVTSSALTTGTGNTPNNAETLRIRALLNDSATKLDVALVVVTGSNIGYIGGVDLFFTAEMPSVNWQVSSPQRAQIHLFSSNPSTGNTLAALTTLDTFGIPVTVAGDYVSLRAAGTMAANGNAKTLSLDIGGAALTIFTDSTNVAGNRWVLDLNLYTIDGTGMGYFGIVTFAAATGTPPTVNHLYGSLTVTTTTAVLVTIQGQATATNDITLNLVHVRTEQA